MNSLLIAVTRESSEGEVRGASVALGDKGQLNKVLLMLLLECFSGSSQRGLVWKATGCESLYESPVKGMLQDHLTSEGCWLSLIHI